MKKIIAIPLENGFLCSHFGHCQQFAIINAENNSISGEKHVKNKAFKAFCIKTNLNNTIGE